MRISGHILAARDEAFWRQSYETQFVYSRFVSHFSTYASPMQQEVAPAAAPNMKVNPRKVKVSGLRGRAVLTPSKQATKQAFALLCLRHVTCLVVRHRVFPSLV